MDRFAIPTSTIRFWISSTRFNQKTIQIVYLLACRNRLCHFIVRFYVLENNLNLESQPHKHWFKMLDVLKKAPKNVYNINKQTNNKWVNNNIILYNTIRTSLCALYNLVVCWQCRLVLAWVGHVVLVQLVTWPHHCQITSFGWCDAGDSKLAATSLLGLQTLSSTFLSVTFGDKKTHLGVYRSMFSSAWSGTEWKVKLSDLDRTEPRSWWVGWLFKNLTLKGFVFR